MRRILLLGAAGVAILAPVTEALAQGQPPKPPPPPEQEFRRPLSGGDRLAHLGVNGALGGFSAAMYALARGKNPWRAALVGFGGGVAMGAGKQVAARRFDGSGLIGRQLAALGTSVVRSASEDTLVMMVPVGPMTLEVRPSAVDRVRPRVNLVSAGTVLYYIVRADTRIDWDATLSAGAPVFRFPTETVATRDGVIFGRMDFGTILLGAAPPVLDPQRRMTLPHEATHVVQYDFLEQALSLPPERAILRKLGVSEGWLRHVDVGAISVMLAGVLQMHMDYEDRPWEREAVLLTEGRR
ncbi:MAG TPA: hypothetical protein VH638_00420 [Gemmatimonadaceae bacterium]|jgi:hypothetical protein